MQPNKPIKNKRPVSVRILRGVGIFLLSLIALVVLILLLLQTAPVQNFARGKIVSFLENKLQTRVEIKRLDIDFPKMLVLEGVYIQDKTKDTLLAGHQLKVDIAMWKLLDNEIQINEINLNGITAKIKRQLPDTTFNFQFIVDAFVTDQAKPATADTAAMKMAIDKIIVDKTRLVYQDVVTGNDVDVYLGHLDTRIDKFDPDNLTYDVSSIKINGLRGWVKQTAPLEVTVVNTNPAPSVANEKPQFLKFTNKETLLSDIDFAYANTVSAINSRFRFKELKLYPEAIDMEKFVVALREIQLNELDGYVTMNAAPKTDVVKLTTQNDQEIQAEYLPWKFTVGAIRLNNNRFVFNDNTQPRQRRGMDYAHLGIADLTLHADNFLFHRDTIAANITRGTMREQSGFVLNELTTDLRYTEKGAVLNDLLIRTPGTEIKRSAAIRYPSLAALQRNMGLMELNLDIDNSRIQVKDILTFAPDLAAQPAFRNPNSTIYLNSRITGSVASLNIQELQLRGFQNTSVDLSGTIANATNPDNVSANLNIRNISTTRGDILSFVPSGSIPSNITLPERISLNGIVRGGMKSAYANVNIGSSLGGAKIHGRINNATNPNTASYAADVSTTGLNVGRLIQQPETIGRITAGFTVRGTGFDPERANAKISGIVRSAEYNKYTYKNLRLDAALARQRFSANANIVDPNIHLALQAEGDLAGELPGFRVTADIDSIKTGPLNLTPDPMIYRGRVVANFPEFNMDALNGEIYMTNSLLVANNQRVKLDSLEVVAHYENNQQLITAKTDFVNATISGQYKLVQLGDVFIDVIQPYYAINTGGKKTLPDPYDFTIDAVVFDHPTLRAFVPDLTRLDEVRINATLSSSDGINAKVAAPFVALGPNKIEGLNLTAVTQGGKLQVLTNVDEISNGTAITMLGTRVTANIADNKVDFALRIGDRSDRNKYMLQGLLSQEPGDVFALTLRPDSLVLNYEPWSINNNNLIRFGPTLVNASNFDLSKGNQHLIINSQGTAANSPMEVRFSDFRLATLTAFVQTDSLLADGTLNGNVLLRNLTTLPNFTTDLTINNLAIYRDTIGDLNAKIDNSNSNVFATNVTITGRGNDVALTGNYYLKPQNNSNIDLNLAIRSLQMNTLEGASMGNIRNASGYLSGNVKIGGTAASPDIDGKINFNDTRMVISMLGSEFKIDNEALVLVDNEGLTLNRFTIRDSADSRLTLNGSILTKNYLNYKLDLTVRARNFMALNNTKKDNELYYGRLFFDTNLRITGTETEPVIDGTLRINEDTRLWVVLPQAQPGVVEREGIVMFIDKDDPLSDSLFLAAIDTLNKTAIMGMDLSANIEVDKGAQLNLVIDEANGDFVNLQGEAILTGGIDPSGKMTLAGTYELESGSYEMSFNFIRRRFDILKGSKITWTGEPTDAMLDVTAVYVANTSAIELVQDQIVQARNDARYRQKLPFEVHLMMDGQLMTPVLTFDIVLPEESSVRIDNEIAGQVELRLNQLKSEPSELNKQVFALLLLNRFISENPFETAGGDGNSMAGSLARQSVSKILTEQLNNLTDKLIAGVDINFDVVSSEDYTSGQLRNRTDLNVAVSKRLLNDRLNVSVGKMFELEGGQKTAQTGAGNTATAPDISVEYYLTQDGRYLLRAYRRNEYEGVVEGYVLETGVGFAMNVDYNRFKEIFEMRKSRRAMARERRDRRKEEKTSQPPERSANQPLGSTGYRRPDPALDNTRKDENEN